MTFTQSNFRFPFPLVLFLILLSLGSCSSGLEDKLIGTWQGSDYLFAKNEGPDLVATLNGGLEQHLMSTLTLSEDGTFAKLVGEYDNGKGTWEVKEELLITTNEEGDKFYYTLLKVTDTELVTSQEVHTDTPGGKISGKIILNYTR